jgi:hypothetical protein
VQLQRPVRLSLSAESINHSAMFFSTINQRTLLSALTFQPKVLDCQPQVSQWLRRTYQTGHIHAGIGIIKNKVSVAPFYHALHIIIVISLDVRLGVLEQSERNPSPSQSVSEQSERNPSPFQMGVVSCRSSREENVLCWTQAR